MYKMTKKAFELSLETLVKVIFVLFVLPVFISFNYKIRDDRLHKLRVETRDYAFTRNTILASPDNVNYNYKVRENITLSLNEEKCIISAKYKDDNTPPLKFFCGVDKTVRLQQQELEKNIKIIK